MTDSKDIQNTKFCSPTPIDLFFITFAKVRCTISRLYEECQFMGHRGNNQLAIINYRP